MNFKSIALSAALLSLSNQAMSQDWCKTFSKTRESLSATTVIDTKDVSKLTTEQVKMIQLAVLVNSVHYEDRPLGVEDTLEIFNDTYGGRTGSLGGDISIFDLKARSGKTQKVALVVYYPGDNEYGALFALNTYSDGVESSSFIGTVGDSDVRCLNYVN
jgi:hypothetical protein